MTPQLDPQAQALLDVMRAYGSRQPYEGSVEDARAQIRAALVTKGRALALHRVEDMRLPTPSGPLAIRLYRPSAGVLPVALFLHGGGWALNDLDTHDHLCRRIALRSGWMLAALDYRRAPEHLHPAPLHDALIAYRWLLDNAARIEADVSRLAIVGESSGGTTVACLALLLRDLGVPAPALQVLAYPMTDLSGDWPSRRERAEGYALDERFVCWALENYLPPGHDLSDPYLAPMSAADLSGVAPAMILTAEFDPLRDEGIAYARRLAEAGVRVKHVHADDQMHGFLLHDRAIDRAGVLIDRLADELAGLPCHLQPATL